MRHSPRFSMWLKLRSVQKISPACALIFALRFSFSQQEDSLALIVCRSVALNFLPAAAYSPPRLQGLIGKATMLYIAYASRDWRSVIL